LTSIQPSTTQSPPPRRASLTQQNAPLFEQLQRCAQRDTAAFHTPGHKAGVGADAALQEAWGGAVLGADLPELPELDNLFAPSGVIAEAQGLAAQAFGADQTWFLANGSTAGIVAAILATCGPGDGVLLPRTVHGSVVSGLILSGARPVFVAPAYDPGSGLVGGLTAEAVEQALMRETDIRAVMLVAPSYEGICGETEAIARLCHQRNLPLLVDEAHGPHFGFHPGLPPSALSLGADLVVQSTHKVLSALTQAAMVHVRGGRVDRDRLTQSLALIQSTSPNYLLLASLDAARRQMATAGDVLMEQTLALACDARQRLSELPGLRVLGLPRRPGFTHLDLTRLTVAVDGLGMSGFEVDEKLCEDYGAIAELPSPNRLTFVVSLGNRPADIDRLVAGFTAISKTAVPSSQVVLGAGSGTGSGATAGRPVDFRALASKVACTPRAAFYAPQRTVEIQAAIGHAAAETVCPYPPGIPVLLPGEVVTAEAVSYLQQVQAQGGVISGCADETLATLRIVA